MNASTLVIVLAGLQLVAASSLSSLEPLQEQLNQALVSSVANGGQPQLVLLPSASKLQACSFNVSRPEFDDRVTPSIVIQGQGSTIVCPVSNPNVPVFDVKSVVLRIENITIVRELGTQSAFTAASDHLYSQTLSHKNSPARPPSMSGVALRETMNRFVHSASHVRENSKVKESGERVFLGDIAVLGPERPCEDFPTWPRSPDVDNLGGIIRATNSSLSLSNIVLKGGKADRGGCVGSFAGNVSIVSSTFEGCSATQGGAVYAWNEEFDNSIISVRDSKFVNCSVSTRGKSVGISTCSILDDSKRFQRPFFLQFPESMAAGGAVYSTRLNLFDSNNFRSCSAVSSGEGSGAFGGSVFLHKMSHSSLKNLEVVSCSAECEGAFCTAASAGIVLFSGSMTSLSRPLNLFISKRASLSEIGHFTSSVSGIECKDLTLESPPSVGEFSAVYGGCLTVWHLDQVKIVNVSVQNVRMSSAGTHGRVDGAAIWTVAVGSIHLESFLIDKVVQKASHPGKYAKPSELDAASCNSPVFVFLSFQVSLLSIHASRLDFSAFDMLQASVSTTTAYVFTCEEIIAKEMSLRDSSCMGYGPEAISYSGALFILYGGVVNVNHLTAINTTTVATGTGGVAQSGTCIVYQCEVFIGDTMTAHGVSLHTEGSLSYAIGGNLGLLFFDQSQVYNILYTNSSSTCNGFKCALIGGAVIPVTGSSTNSSMSLYGGKIYNIERECSGFGCIIQGAGVGVFDAGLYVENFLAENVTFRSSASSSKLSGGVVWTPFGEDKTILRHITVAGVLFDCTGIGQQCNGAGMLLLSSFTSTRGIPAVVQDCIIRNSFIVGGSQNQNASTIMLGAGVWMDGNFDRFNGNMSVVASNVTIQDSGIYTAKAAAFGGGLGLNRGIELNCSRCNIQNCVVASSHNVPAPGGGAIANYGHLFLSSSTLLNNTSTGVAGGIFSGLPAGDSGSIRLLNSSIQGNVATHVGALFTAGKVGVITDADTVLSLGMGRQIDVGLRAMSVHLDILQSLFCGPGLYSGGVKESQVMITSIQSSVEQIPINQGTFNLTAATSRSSHVKGQVSLDELQSTSLQAVCLRCPANTYSLTSTSAQLSVDRSCLSCPYGMQCTPPQHDNSQDITQAAAKVATQLSVVGKVGKVSLAQPKDLHSQVVGRSWSEPSGIAAIPGFWSTLSDHGEVNRGYKLALGYGCGGSGKCENFDSCAANRVGTMCGECAQAYGFRLFSSACGDDTDCPTHIAVLFPLVVFYIILYCCFLLWNARLSSRKLNTLDNGGVSLSNDSQRAMLPDAPKTRNKKAECLGKYSKSSITKATLFSILIGASQMFSLVLSNQGLRLPTQMEWLVLMVTTLGNGGPSHATSISSTGICFAFRATAQDKLMFDLGLRAGLVAVMAVLVGLSIAYERRIHDAKLKFFNWPSIQGAKVPSVICSPVVASSRERAEFRSEPTLHSQISPRQEHEMSELASQLTLQSDLSSSSGDVHKTCSNIHLFDRGQAVVELAVTVYTGVVATCMRALTCRQIDGLDGLRWLYDGSHICLQSWQAGMLLLLSAALALPFALYIRARVWFRVSQDSDNNGEQDNLQAFSSFERSVARFYTRLHSPSALHWLPITLLERVMIAALVEVVVDPFTSSILTAGVLVFMLAISASLRPFKLHSWVDCLSRACICLVAMMQIRSSTLQQVGVSTTSKNAEQAESSSYSDVTAWTQLVAIVLPFAVGTTVLIRNLSWSRPARFTRPRNGMI